LVGVSRKSMVGHLTGGRPVSERLAGSLALAALAASRGAVVLRAHDVAETVDAVRVGAAVGRMQGEG
jgi:dihydropteroate synthase